MPKTTHNDEERRQWVENDEGLYTLYRQSEVSLRTFIQQHRPAIDGVIDAVTRGGEAGSRPALRRESQAA